MKIEYTLTRDDYIQFYLYLRERARQRFLTSRAYWPVVALAWLALGGGVFALYFAVFKGLLCLVLCAFPQVQDNNQITVLLAGLTTALALGVIAYRRPWRQRDKYGRMWLLRRRVRSYERGGRLFIGHRCELVLSERELALTVRKEGEERGAHYAYRREYRVPWGEVQAIDEFDMHAFILTRGSMGVFIPKSAFRDVLAFREFLESAGRFRAGMSSTAISASMPGPQINTGIQTSPPKPAASLEPDKKSENEKD